MFLNYELFNDLKISVIKFLAGDFPFTPPPPFGKVFSKSSYFFVNI
jgi:hypothetical protein